MGFINVSVEKLNALLKVWDDTQEIFFTYSTWNH